MKCPKCGFMLNNVQICPACGEDTYILAKILNNSIRLYNTALLKAKLKDFSGAIELCKKSLYFNKNNIYARNLLGLLYYQKGNLADGIKQWIISSNIDTDKENLAFYYMDIFKKDIRKFETLDDAVGLYNQAISYLQTQNDDLAIIRLKKALDINPTFVEAMNLLGFCYILQKKYKSALKILHSVLDIDINNDFAKRYILEIEEKRNKNNDNTNLLEGYNSNGVVKTIEDDEDYAKVGNKFGQKIALSFVFGITLSGIIMYFLFIPAAIQKKDSKINELELQIAKIRGTDVASAEENDVQKLQEENTALKNEIQTYIAKDNINKNIEKLSHSIALYEKNQKSDAKNVLETVDTTGFNEEFINKYNEMKDKVNK